jgi:hypothetical protein
MIERLRLYAIEWFDDALGGISSVVVVTCFADTSRTFIWMTVEHNGGEVCRNS